MSRYLTSLLLACAFPPLAMAADIAAQNAWTFALDHNDLAAGAGTDLRSPIESAAGLLTLDIGNTGGASWIVKARRSETGWASGTGLSVRRTSDGTGSGTIGGGNAYVALSGTDQTLFSGSGDRTGIRVQLRLDNASVHTPPGSYSGTVIYSVQ